MKKDLNRVNNLRHFKMKDYIRDKKRVSINELAKRFSVSDMTVRRDLDTLESLNLIDRIHGGAVYKELEDEIDTPLSIRATENIELKTQIAEKAFSFIRDNTSILLDAGTTTYEVARLLFENKEQFSNLVIVTNDINIGFLFSKQEVFDLLMPGGELRYSTKSFIGQEVSSFFGNLNIDQAFIGCSGISFEKGVLMNSNLLEASIKTTIIESSEEVILLSDCTKFGKQSLSSFSNLDKMNKIITNKTLDQGWKRKLGHYDLLNVYYV